MKQIQSRLTISQGILITVMGTVLISMIFISGVFIFTFSKETASHIEKQNGEINKNIILNFNKELESIVEIIGNVRLHLRFMDLHGDDLELSEFMDSKTYTKKSIVGIVLLDQEGVPIAGDRINSQLYFDITEQEWFRKALEKNEGLVFSSPHIQSVFLYRNLPVISLSRSIQYKEKGRIKKGIILAELYFSTLFDPSSKIDLGEGGHILILDERDSLIYSSDYSRQSHLYESLNLIRNKIIGGIKTKINNRIMYIHINTLNQTGWRIATVHNMDNLRQSYRKAILLGMIVLITTSLAAFTLALYLASKITRPLMSLKDHMEKVETLDFYSEIDVYGQKEIMVLGHAFNHMTHTIHELMEKVKEEQKKKELSDFKMLQYQINPHFLYNTLDSIAWLAEKGKTEEILSSVLALSRFFRIGVSDEEEFIPLSRELKHIQSYLTIQDIRFAGRFSYTIDVSDDLKSVTVMKLMLQPLVENALNHGISEDGDDLITIKGFRKEGFLILEVSNTGYGISTKKINEINERLRGKRSNESLGLSNVYQRLKLYYGSQADLKISTTDAVTRVQLIIPLEVDSNGAI